MRTDITLIAGIALMALPAPGNTAGAADPESAAAAAPYAIAGAKLMMTPDQVAAALKGSGFRQEGAVMDQASFEDQLQARLTGKGAAHSHAVPSHEEWKKGQETVSVTYMPYPGAARAVIVSWKTESGSPSAQQIVATLEKRYGPGWRFKPFLPPQWCTPKPCTPNSPTLTAGTSDIGLTAPRSMSEPGGLNHRLDMAVQAKGGSKGSF